ncbi:MAG: xylose isomerase [Thermotoga sp.]|jgi:xylose isomerase|nr:xylose isomerase [Thermotoga sp.]
MAEFFPEIPKIQFEGKESTNPLAFKFYDPNEVIDGKPLKDHLKFSVAFWHTFVNEGRDPFGDPTAERPWNRYSDPMDKAFARVDALFEFCEKLNIEYFCFHDRDIAPEGKTLRETNKILDKVVERIKERMKDSNVKLLWGTANLFSHPRYMHGAATTCSADVFAYAAAQVKKALEITKELGGEGYVFWGGREGYETLLNTDLGLELENLARFLRMAVEYAKKIGFTGQFLIEPKPKEPTKHQYDFDVATAYAFLKNHGLDEYFKFNIEANHATLAGHTFQHELRMARILGKLGSIDANQGDLLLGWDTDQFPTNIYDTTLAMYEVIKAGGFTKGGLNFDAKVRRASYKVEDLFIGHIAGMDTFALGFKIAYKLVKDGVFDKFIEEKYRSFKEGIGKEIVEGKTDFEKLEEYIIDKEDIELPSGKQEYLESLLNSYIVKTIAELR